MPPYQSDGRVVRVETCNLTAVDRPWPYAQDNAGAIDAHWRRRTAENPKFFNGRIRMLSSHAINGGTLYGQFLETEFKNFLYWREQGEPETGVRDAFGSALIRSRDGGVLLGRQRAGNVNTGVAYLPGGFIDPRDVGVGGRIDIAASTAREVMEETGLSAQCLIRQPGIVLAFYKCQLSIVVEYSCDLQAAELFDQVMAHLSADEASELADVVIVHRKSDLEGMALAPYAGLLLATLLA